MTTVQILEKLVELQEARFAAGIGHDGEAAQLVIDAVESHTSETERIFRTLRWMTIDMQQKIDDEQECESGQGHYSSELTEALNLIAGK